MKSLDKPTEKSPHGEGMRVVMRERLPATRQSVTRKFSLPDVDGNLKLYVTVGLYDDGRPGEVFIKADKVGSLSSGAFDAVALSISIGLQYGVPLKAFLDKLIGMRFAPAGFTGDKQYPSASSVLDLVARWMRDQFCKEDADG